VDGVTQDGSWVQGFGVFLDGLGLELRERLLATENV